MKKFLAIYLGSAEEIAEWKAADESTRKEKEKVGMDGWKKWSVEHEKAIVDLGTPIGKTKRINTQGISDTRNEIGAYTIVQAESHEEAAKLFIDHPHFTIFPGDSVEVMECLMIPGM
jgi:hypothetical protein